MDGGDLAGLFAIVSLFIGLPWIILHHITKWKTAATLTSGDEALLEELYQLARRLDERMDTVERLVVADHPEFHLGKTLDGLTLADRETDNQLLSEIDLLRRRKQGKQGNTR